MIYDKRSLFLLLLSTSYLLRPHDAFHVHVLTGRQSVSRRTAGLVQQHQHTLDHVQHADATGAAERTVNLHRLQSSSSDDDGKLVDEDIAVKVETFLEKKFPSFCQLILNKEMRNVMKESSPRVTIFAPNEAAFANLGEKRLIQVKDPRNDEIREKLGSYHLVPSEAIAAVALRTEDWSRGRPKDGGKPDTKIAGVVTMEGEVVPVGRRSNKPTDGVGFLGALFGGGEDGEDGDDDDIVIGPAAKIVQSYEFRDDQSTIIVHEVDAFVSPDLVWRYLDQLRIPGF